ncbi:hypothetical protein [Methylobacterium nonmethylotrophicum]|uniref:hypothetical protein n=1 Tax=Methylobacterium nonmethylotrophicum TaxID=1141884 RepID=UPI001436B1B3|nr:hypothetical protein [Methylobacterium nonmethylotrophicum]
MIALAQAWRAGLTRRTQRATVAREAATVRVESEHHELTARELIRMAQSARAATEPRG